VRAAAKVSRPPHLRQRGRQGEGGRRRWGEARAWRRGPGRGSRRAIMLKLEGRAFVHPPPVLASLSRQPSGVRFRRRTTPSGYIIHLFSPTQNTYPAIPMPLGSINQYATTTSPRPSHGGTAATPLVVSHSHTTTTLLLLYIHIIYIIYHRPTNNSAYPRALKRGGGRRRTPPLPQTQILLPTTHRPVLDSSNIYKIWTPDWIALSSPCYVLTHSTSDSTSLFISFFFPFPRH